MASNANFGLGSVDPNVAPARIGADGKVCFVNSNTPSSISSRITSARSRRFGYTPPTLSGAPDRKVDTRIGLGGESDHAVGSVVFRRRRDQPGDVAVVNLTPVEAGGAWQRAACFV